MVIEVVPLKGKFQTVLKCRDGVPCHLVSAAIAGVTATVVASPVDVVKTR